MWTRQKIISYAMLEINDDISKDGITKDLQAMKEAGIGAAFIGNINPDGVDGKEMA